MSGRHSRGKTKLERTGEEKQMIKIRKMAAVLTAAALTAGLLAGCGGAAQQKTAAAETSAAESAAAAAEGSTAAEAGGEKNETAGEKETGSAGEKQLREINVVLDWYPNAIHSFLYAAIERGYFEEEGLDVKIRFPANENDAIALVAADKAEIGLYYQQDTIQAIVNQGVKIKSIGAVCQTPLNVILSLKEKNVNSPADFAGKTVGYGGTALSEAMVEAIMENAGADPKSVNLLNVGFDLMSSMTTGQVDATIGCLVNHEVPQLEEEGFEVSWFQLTDYGLPNFYELVFLANDRMIAEEPEVLKGFLRACSRGFADFRDDTDAVLQILLDNQSAENFPLSPAVEKKSAEVLLPRMETADAPFETQTEENWKENIDWMKEHELINRVPEVSEVMVELK